MSENQPDHGHFMGVWPEEAIHEIMRIGCGQEEPWSIMCEKISNRKLPLRIVQ